MPNGPIRKGVGVRNTVDTSVKPLYHHTHMLTVINNPNYIIFQDTQGYRYRFAHMDVAQEFLEYYYSNPAAAIFAYHVWLMTEEGKHAQV